MALERSHVRQEGPTVASDWKAVGFRSNGGPLVLVEFSEQGMSSRTAMSRLDTAKKILLDPLPFSPMSGAMRELVEWVNANSARRHAV